MRELLRAAFVIARRDFAATVFSRAFLLFLLAPLFPVLMGVIFGSITGGFAADVQRPTVAVVAERAEFVAMATARDRLEAALAPSRLVQLRRVPPHRNADRLRDQLLNGKDSIYVGVLEGGLDKPAFTGSTRRDGVTVQQLQLILDHARRIRAEGPAPPAPMDVAITSRSTGALASARTLTARAGQSVLFILTVLLAGMLLSQLIEEKSNKVIEVLAAAVPVDSIFLGKLLAMLSASLLGIAVWTLAGATAIAIFSKTGLAALPPPATGWPMFLLLAVVYFAMSYLLLGAVFLGIGAHASSAREVQTLSMPATMAQVVFFAFAAVAVGEPNGVKAIGAAIFPLSSPYVMIARAAELPAFWPHLAAVAWQMLWVAIILRVASRLFRRSVLKSGPGRRPARA